MPKKQKQKQSQKTSVVVNVGASKSKKGVSRRPRTAPAPVRHPQSISVTLQGSSMNLPAPLTNDYNTILKQLSDIQRQQAASGSLIPNMGRNDLLNRVQATNPFTSRSTNTQREMLNPYEGEMEEVVEASTTYNSFDNGPYDAQIPIDQDFIRQARISKIGQNLGEFTDKIGILSDLTEYDDENLEDKLASSVAASKKRMDKYFSEDKSDDEVFSRGVVKRIGISPNYQAPRTAKNPYFKNRDITDPIY